MKLFVTTLAIVSSLLLAAPAVANAAGVEEIVAKKAATLELLFRKAKKALVNAAQDKSFHDYFSTQPHENKARLKERIDRISLSVQSRFHVAEMCLIGSDGAEVSRIVGQQISQDLDPDESDAVFFKLGFEQKRRKVYISPIYMSGDADIWVVAFVTPIVVAGEKHAILHYEHTLARYQDALNKGMSGNTRFVVAVNADGWVVSDSRKPVPTDKRGELDVPEAYFEKFEFLGMGADEIRSVIDGAGSDRAAVLSADGESYSATYKIVENWTLIAIERRNSIL